MIEQGVDAREIEVGVLGNGDPRASVPGEIVSSHEFYDYDDKYVDGTCELLVPAPLDEAATAAVQDLALRRSAPCAATGSPASTSSTTRTGAGFLVNEVNTIPGFTPASMYPRLWEASGVPYPALVDELVQLAIERHERRSRFSTKR